jgi:hypothetical protein
MANFVSKAPCAFQSADAHNITNMCLVWLTAKAWAMVGVEDWQSRGAVPCAVEGDFLQVFTSVGFLQFPRSQGGVIVKIKH